MLPEKFIESNVKYEVPYTKTIEFQTELEQEKQTEENLINELRANAEAYLEENKYPKVSYTTISNINNKMEIGDTIQVLHPLVTIKTEVLEYEYDEISKKMKSLTFGNFSRDVKTKFENIKSTINQLNQTLSNQLAVINKQTNLINSLNKTGYVYITENEILILDELPKEQSKNVWRFGLGGIGFSSNGYEGPFELAITMDGQINADFITTGTMSVSRIAGLANKISEYDTEIAEIKLENGNIISSVTEVRTMANTANTNAQNAQSTADGINNNLTENYYTKTETNSQITQKANEISTEVNKKVNDSELGTKITQNYNSVQVAWNTISEFIQFINASLNILNSNKEKLLNLNQNGLTLYDDLGIVLIRMTGKGFYTYREDGTVITSSTIDGLRIFDTGNRMRAKVLGDGLYIYDEEGVLEASVANGGFHSYASDGTMLNKLVEDGLYLYDALGKTMALLKNNGTLNISSTATIGGDISTSGNIYANNGTIKSQATYDENTVTTSPKMYISS